MESKYFVNAVGGVHGPDIFTPLGRQAFVYLAKRNDKFVNERTGKGKYGVTLLFDKNDEAGKAQLKELQALCNDMATFYATKEWNKTDKKVPFAKFKDAVIAKFAAQPFLRDGDMAKYEGFSGHWFIVAKNDENSGPQGIVFHDNRHAEEFEAGQWVRAQVQPYVDQKGFSYKLRRIKLVKDDGTRFSAGGSAPDMLSGLDDAVAAVVIAEKTNGQNGSSLAAEFDKAVSEVPASKSLDIL